MVQVYTQAMNSHQRSTVVLAGSYTDRGWLSNLSGSFPFVLGSILLGTIGIFVREAHAAPLTATWFRCAFGWLGMTLWILLRGQTSHLLPSRSSLFRVLAAAMLMVIAWGLFFAAIDRIPVGIATVLFHVQPLWVLVLGAWWLKETIAGQRVLSVMAAMIGLVLATGLLDHLTWAGNASGGGFQLDYWVGVAFCLTGSFCTACVTIIARQLREMPAGVLAWWQCATGTAALLIYPLMQGWPAWGLSWMWLSGLGIIHTGLAYSLIYAGIARLSTDRIAVFQFIYPAVAIVIDWLFYGQRLENLQMSGIVLMAVAIWFAERTPSPHQTILSDPRDNH
ncbi:MAG: DMT family transporter [Deltaproteobacteria bacterium]|nr:DMT family transporter [Deltaproteobacteria bacterium]